MFENEINQIVYIGSKGQDVKVYFPNPEFRRRLCNSSFPLWHELADSEPEERLVLLIRGLIYLDRGHGNAISSITPVPVLYKGYARRFPDLEPLLTRWIVLNRINPHQPFGSIICNDAQSLAEFELKLDARSAAQRAAHKIATQAQQARDEEAKVRRGHIATGRLARAVRRGYLSDVEAQLDRGADPKRALPEGESLVELALSHGRLEVAEYLKKLGIQ